MMVPVYFEFYIIKRIYDHRCFYYYSNVDDIIIWTPKEDNAFLFDTEEQARYFKQSVLAKRECSVLKIIDHLR